MYGSLGGLRPAPSKKQDSTWKITKQNRAAATGREPALQAQGPEFNPGNGKKKKKKSQLINEQMNWWPSEVLAGIIQVNWKP
jgi:hypothetical protein